VQKIIKQKKIEKYQKTISDGIHQVDRNQRSGEQRQTEEEEPQQRWNF
jgi:hypothetical protein